MAPKRTTFLFSKKDVGKNWPTPRVVILQKGVQLQEADPLTLTRGSAPGPPGPVIVSAHDVACQTQALGPPLNNNHEICAVSYTHLTLPTILRV